MSDYEETTTSESDLSEGVGAYCVRMRRQEVARGVLRINTDIMPAATNLWLQELDDMRVRGVEEITLKINSYGGSADHGVALYDFIVKLRKVYGIKVIAEVEGCAASAAAVFPLQAADYRIAGQHARILIHEVRGELGYGRASDQRDQLEAMERINKIMFAILEERTGHDYKFWSDRSERHETWSDADQARDLGLVDEVV